MVLRYTKERTFPLSSTGLLPSLANLSSVIPLEEKFFPPHCRYWHLATYNPRWATPTDLDTHLV